MKNASYINVFFAFKNSKLKKKQYPVVKTVESTNFDENEPAFNMGKSARGRFTADSVNYISKDLQMLVRSEDYIF